jgi:hypothetical protein
MYCFYFFRKTLKKDCDFMIFSITGGYFAVFNFPKTISAFP